MARRPARLHLLGLIAAAVVPVWLFAAYLLAQYAFNERARFEREAVRAARQVSQVVEGNLRNLLTVLEGLSKSSALADGEFQALHAEAVRVVQGTDRIVLLRDFDRRQILNTQLPYQADLPPAVPLSSPDLARLQVGLPAVSDVYASPISNEYRIAVALPVRGPRGESWLLAITVPTSRILGVMIPAVPAGWTVGIGDRDGTYVARSQMHREMTGQAGLPEYLEKVVGPSGTFTSRNFEGTTLLAGYYRSEFSDWFYAANIPLSMVQAPLWRSLAAIGAIGLLAMIVSAVLAYVVGKGFARAAGDLAARAEALGQGRAIAPLSTAVSEFSVIADALIAAGHALAEREYELETVLETVPAAVWFTYDPNAREVIRNRFALELMELPTETRTSFRTPEQVIDTIAVKDGNTVSREDRPLSRAMRGEQIDNEEFAYKLPSGVERILLSSARPIYDGTGKIIGAVQISLDITERKRGEEQRKLLVNELNHRVKNTLAIVQSIVSQTLRSAKSLPEAGHSVTSRLVSLSRAHDILTKENWSGADLESLAVASVTPHAVLDRFQLSGGPVWLPPPLALSLALALHELTTNAIKYGALTTDLGTVSLAWITSGQAEGRRLRIEWREHGGPLVAPLGHRGFGIRMIERLLDPDGSASIAFEPTGLVCVLEVAIGSAGK